MTGKASLDNIIVGISTLVAMVLLGIFVYTEVIFEKDLPSNKTEYDKLIKEVESKTFTESFKLPKMTINLPSKSKRLRFIEVEMQLTPFKADDIKLIEEKTVQVKDTIISSTSKMAPNELNTVTGKILLENRLRKNLNQSLGRDVVKEIYFTHYVVQ